MNLSSAQKLDRNASEDEEDLFQLATNEFLADGSDQPTSLSAPVTGAPSPSGPSSPLVGSQTNFSCFAEQLGHFAKSLGGFPEAGQAVDLEHVVQSRSCMVAKQAAHAIMKLRDGIKYVGDGAAASPNTSDPEEQVNDETIQQQLFTDSQVTEVFDPTFRFCFEVPTANLVHLPPSRLNITRLVFCRNYVPGEHRSCSMGDGCKFVHADVDFRVLEAHPIHVKYAWRHEDVCTYARLPAGETLRVSAPNNRPPVEEIPSERVLVTRGALKRHDSHGPLSHCAHYYFNRMCNRGERCNFVHVVFVDPNVTGDFKRAPCCKPKTSNAAPGVASDAANGTRVKLRSCAAAGDDAEGHQVLPSSFGGGGRAGGDGFKPNSHAAPLAPHGATAIMGNVVIPPTIPVQMPPPPNVQPGGGLHASHNRGSQYGMLVFVPCDASQPSMPITPAVFNPPAMHVTGVPSVNVLPVTALDLMHAAYPGLSERWSTRGSDPSTIATASMIGSALQRQPIAGAELVQPQEQQQRHAQWSVDAQPWHVQQQQQHVMMMVQQQYGQQLDPSGSGGYPFHQGDQGRRAPRSRGGYGGSSGYR